MTEQLQPEYEAEDNSLCPFIKTTLIVYGPLQESSPLQTQKIPIVPVAHEQHLLTCKEVKCKSWNRLTKECKLIEGRKITEVTPVM